ncbi:putative TOB3 [Rosellinia necatrix]|uniref:Putative TOB3 n=1 Tax=Rosellinia necatrix TaxID=77044 RepID=A0A1W2TU63_ROSNE|nr:putative TOB3 [Rosellinia necatrix]
MQQIMDRIIDGEPLELPTDGSTDRGSDAPKEATVDIAQVGMTAESKDLFREDYRAPWEEWAMENIGRHSTSAPASSKFALVVRREQRNGDNGDTVLTLHSITIQSPLIKGQLANVFAGYKGINTGLKKLDFNAPFREFYYRWSQFVQAMPNKKRKAPTDDNNDKTDDQYFTAKRHYDLLFNVISAEVTPHIEQMNDLLQNEVISFDYVWALFEPGTEIYSKVDGYDRLFLLNHGEYQQCQDQSKRYVLSCRYIETNGETFGYATTMLVIREFENVIPVTDLAIFPSHLKQGMADIRVRLEERGRKFEELKGLHYKAYSGAFRLQNPRFSGSRKQSVDDSRVIIDCSSFLKYNDNASVQLMPLDASSVSRHETNPSLLYLDGFDEDAVSPTFVARLQDVARRTRRRYAAPQNTFECTHTSLSDEYYALCTPIIKGFSLKLKEWVYLNVDGVADIKWDGDAYKQLVLPHDYKRLIWAFVAAQLSHIDDFDDIIKGKGKGVIMLLSGEPGTGKTLTSESVAEAMKKPLYSMSAGELGNRADEVETNLRRVLELSATWDAVLLLDECDVFLEKRSTSDMERNKLVSVFLRLLEYYEGVMFLTTNRVQAFDPAFESRIHLTIEYPKLDFDSRLSIWRTFVKPTGGKSAGSDGGGGGGSGGVSEAELTQLAQAELNGRQIKNVVKTARLLAAREESTLALEHLQTVMRVKMGFADCAKTLEL